MNIPVGGNIYEFVCTEGKTMSLPSKFSQMLYFSAISDSYLRPRRLKSYTLKAQNHLLDVNVTNAGKPRRERPTTSGGSGMHQESS